MMDLYSRRSPFIAVLLTALSTLRVRFIHLALYCVLLGFSLPMLAQVSFVQNPMYSCSANTHSLFAGDLNGDGKTDLLCSDGTVNLGHGDGSFTIGMPVPGTPLTVADFNGDGKPDILEQGTGTLLVLLGNGDGTFEPAISTPSGASLTSIAAVDLNGDGKADLTGIFNNTLLVYISKGDGTFVAGVSYTLAAAGSVLSVGDFNGDHNLDIVVSTKGNNSLGQVIVLLGNGDGTFQRTTTKTSAGTVNPNYAAMGDFNGDGKMDLAIASGCGGPCSPEGVFILQGNGDGTFQSPIMVTSDNGPVLAGDVDGDGKLDLIVQGAPVVAQVLLGKGDGTFTNATHYVMGMPPQGLGNFEASFGIVVADFNADGKLDLAADSWVLLGNGDGTFQGFPIADVPSSGTSAASCCGFLLRSVSLTRSPKGLRCCRTNRWAPKIFIA